MLFSALGNSNLQKAKKLIEQGVNVNAKDRDGRTLLHKAANFSHYDVVQLLLNKGAYVNAKAKLDCTPLHLAAQSAHDAVVQLLLDNGAGINAQTHEGCTPLYLAAENGRTSVVELLLDNEAEINKYNKKGATPLDIAAEFDHFDVVQLFLKRGADLKTNKNNGCTALHVAAEGGYYGIVKLLLDNGANVNVRAERDLTPLHLAAQNGHSNVVNLLLADPNINVDYVQAKIFKKVEDRKKFLAKLLQDRELFKNVKEAANETDENELDELLIKIKNLLKPENEYGFKPSLNYSFDGNGKTTAEIAIEAGGELLQLLYNYAKDNMGKDSKIFKQLKDAIENSQSSSNLDDVSLSDLTVGKQLQKSPVR